MTPRRGSGQASSPRSRQIRGPRSAFRRPRRRFGQHFLEPAWVDKLIDRLDLQPGDTFLEIGPGRGALTLPLARRVNRVVAVEIDRDLVAALAREVPPNVRLVQGDVLDLSLDEILRGDTQPVRVVGNLPYNVASPILFKLLRSHDAGRRLSDATLMLQREVADRLVASPGTGEYGALTIQVALHANVERVLTLPPGAFRPPPTVTSAVVRLRFRPPAVDVGDPVVFERLVRSIFLQRRKMLANALKPVADSMGRSAPQVLSHAGIDGRRRPETLTLAEVSRLVGAVL
ncbi:MAG: 16S rRNA (adenine(1518)-N(6)/adenine(1519)-N(6))-dimethyltransferase RsmA [Vicinamibacterales bacterium]